MKTIQKILMLGSLLLLTLPLDARKIREQSWEILFTPQFISGKSFSFSKGTKIDFNDRSGWSFGLGYSFTEHLTLDLNFASSSSNYTATIINDKDQTEELSASLYSSSITADMSYNLLNQALTPYINGHLGSSFIDTGIWNGEIYSGCWFHPYWGYICSPVAGTHTRTEFAYGGGLGLRYDAHNRLLIKAGIDTQVISLESKEFPYVMVYYISFGATF